MSSWKNQPNAMNLLETCPYLSRVSFGYWLYMINESDYVELNLKLYKCKFLGGVGRCMSDANSMKTLLL